MAKKTTRASKAAKPKKAPGEAVERDDLMLLRLYVAGQTPRASAAITNLKSICDEHCPGRYHVEVIDLLKTPQLAKGDQIVAIPTLVRKLPQPVRKIIGDMSNVDKVLIGLDLRRRV